MLPQIHASSAEKAENWSSIIHTTQVKSEAGSVEHATASSERWERRMCSGQQITWLFPRELTGDLSLPSDSPLHHGRYNADAHLWAST